MTLKKRIPRSTLLKRLSSLITKDQILKSFAINVKFLSIKLYSYPQQGLQGKKAEPHITQNT